jgi:hypothetical protein
MCGWRSIITESPLTGMKNFIWRYKINLAENATIWNIIAKKIENLIAYTYVLKSLTHGAEPFLRSRQVCSYSRTSQQFMGPEGSLPCSQEPSTGPIQNHINPKHTIPLYLSKIHFNIVHPPTPWSSQWSLSSYVGPLSPRHGAFSGCGWRRRE